MRTITFYSYKGGVGRSLLVANAAKYLATLGKNVVALDLDLEAPGLHYKFGLDANTKLEVSAGIVDILYHFINELDFPSSLSPYIRDVATNDGHGWIKILPAGEAPSKEYWNALSRINWHDILYGDSPVGLPFFLELKQRIEEELNPDFLLIDARTGITEMGGLATTYLPETVVCIALPSREHLEGLSAVVDGIRGVTSEMQILLVLSRLSSKYFVNEAIVGLQELIKKTGQDELYTLHSEPFLERGETLLIGGKISPHDLRLLRDYLKLFSAIIPAKEIRPYVGQLVEQAVSKLLDDPDAAQSALEALTAYCADEEAYRALLKLYLLRKTSFDKVLATASLMFQLVSSADSDPLLADIVESNYNEVKPGETQKKYLEFAEAIWQSTGRRSERVAITLATLFLPERRAEAERVLYQYIESNGGVPTDAVVRLMEIVTVDPGNAGRELIKKFKSFISTPSFYVAWARLVVAQRDKGWAAAVLRDSDFRSDLLTISDPAMMYRMKRLAGDPGTEQFLEQVLEAAVISENLPQLRSLAELYGEEGNVEEFEMQIHRRLAPRVAQEIVAVARRRYRKVPLLT